MVDEHQEAIRAEFARQASSFEDPRYSFGRPDILAWIAAHTPTSSDDLMLEVAAGTGWVARALAGSVRAAVATDITPEMLAAGKSAADRAGIDNIVFQEADACRLPFLDGSFSLVTCRLALHHLPDPGAGLAEMVRVCRPGGHLVVIDITAPPGPVGEAFNRFEHLRDPTHTTALTSAELRHVVERAGARPTAVHTRENRVIVDLWLRQTNTPRETASDIIEAFEQEISGGQPTGFTPRRGADGLEFLHQWELVVATV